ncbi:hypothetical protein [Methanosarcina sp.]|uniref:hypothetical protein n=1 Tax=Methanosarcina sp. TaxID=2213 RepID=UPI002988B729|nr:hypothetical protein [Methanosarcina sp.]MDW5549889.1 hypothetical protein [Methanosarcina sp.]MDW5552493.1 hypothetical protein [Methanosarcina sp.]MDW5560223.1 hypothetical protein [Methanosarcina sp.]
MSLRTDTKSKSPPRLSKAPGFLFAPACEEKQTGVRVLKKREIEFEAFYLSISQEYILCILLLYQIEILKSKYSV